MRKNTALFALLTLSLPPMLALAPRRTAQNDPTAPNQKFITVKDVVEMRHWADHDYFLGGESTGRVALFSKNGKRIVVVLRQGNLARNTNDYQILLFDSHHLFTSRPVRTIATFSSSSNREAISGIKWLDDSRTLVFLAEVGSDGPQIYSLDVETQRLTRLTDARLPIVKYVVSGDGKEFIYEAAARAPDCTNATNVSLAITTQTPSDLFQCGHLTTGKIGGSSRILFVHRVHQETSKISARDFVSEFLPLSLAPNGRYALLAVDVRDIPSFWSEYQNRVLHPYIVEPRRPGSHSIVAMFLVIDTVLHTATPLLGTPIAWENTGFAWSKDGRSLILSGAYLPLDVPEAKQRQIRLKDTFVVEVQLPSRRVLQITAGPWKVDQWEGKTGIVVVSSGTGNQRKTSFFRKEGDHWVEVSAPPTAAPAPVKIALEEDINHPPKIYATENGSKSLLVDLNPQFREFRFGKEEVLTWKASDGHLVTGGLYYPPDYKAGRRYPLVIQTHGFRRDRFWIDGPWSSAFAAQPLAAKDIMVLQVGNSADPAEDIKVVDTPEEAPRQMAAYEGAIEYLDARGLIDPARVGIIGFSRTVLHVEFTLTHSRIPFAAAVLADGFDGGYVNYLLWQSTSYVNVNGGSPFGSTLALWLKNSPGFNLTKVNTPVRLEYYGPAGFLGGWQWFSGLTLLRQPVDLSWIPDGVHLLFKPIDRMASLGQTVDWFCFWLEGKKDPDPNKRSQYQRWEQLRSMHASAREKSATAMAAPEQK